MKKKYESLELAILLFGNQDVITSSVYVEWEDDWTGNQGENWIGGIFG